MPIPSLSRKTTSPQTWKKRNAIRRGSTSSFGKHPGRRRLRLPFTLKRLSVSRGFWKPALIAGGVGIGVLGLASIAFLASITKDLPNPNRIIDRTVAQSTKIYDRTGEHLLFDIHGNERRTLVPLNELPKHLVNATLTAEDRHFYEHGGISFTGILRSVIKNVTTGSKVSGSTLTQQLVKNAILSSEKTYTRKAREIILSWQIEKNFSKDEILQLYFNEIPYGSVAYGAEAAAQTYFGKSVRDITLPEAAILAALPQAPTYYSPYGNNTDALFTRQRWILDNMAELGYITEEDARLTKEQEVVFKERRDDNIIAPHLVMHVREYLTKKYGELTVEQGGLQVITTLDLFKHDLAQKVINEISEKNLEKNASNAAMVVIDPKTGQVLVMIGSRDYFNEDIDGQVNVATRLRQPGSSFKPIVYTAGLIKGYTPDTVLYDVETNFQNYDLRDYQPRNYNLAEHGPVTVRKALAGSLNIPAVKMIYLTGVDNVIDLAEDLGYTSLTDRSRFGLSLVLGGGEVQLLEHTNAYAVFAREGEWHPITTILEVRDKDGNVLEKYERKEKKVLATETARQMNQMLSDNNARAYIFGQNNFLTLGGRPVAAKTGTTNDYRDAWTIGYTPSLVTGVWVGNNDNTPMNFGADSSQVAAPIWHAFMSQVLGDTPIEQFKDPQPVETTKPVLNGNIAQGTTVKINRVTGKLATNQTPDYLVEEKTFKQAHNILHYINKDDPRGDTPPDRSGEQYKRWEEAVVAWAAKNGFVNEEPPTEFDTDYTNNNRPNITITTPSAGTVITDRNFSANVSASAPRGVSRVEYALNGQIIGTVTNAPFSLSLFIEDPSITNGSYQLTATAFDDIDNRASANVTLNFNLPAAPSALSWTSPTNGQVIPSTSFPFTIKGGIRSGAQISKIDLFYKDSNGNENYINTIRQFPGNVLSASWLSVPGPGNYTLYAYITNSDGFSYKSDEVGLNVN